MKKLLTIFTLGLILAGQTFAHDHTVIAKIKLNGAGKWFVRFAGFVRVAGKTYDHESAWATLSFEVR